MSPCTHFGLEQGFNTNALASNPRSMDCLTNDWLQLKTTAIQSSPMVVPPKSITIPSYIMRHAYLGSKRYDTDKEMMHDDCDDVNNRSLKASTFQLGKGVTSSLCEKD